MISDRPCRIAVLGSGKGSNMASVARACAERRLPAEVVTVLTDVPDAGILDRAQEWNVPGRYVPPGRFRTKLEDEVEAEYVRLLREAGAEWVVLAGFMRVLRAGLLRAFPQRVVNIHPSLLPAFPGLEAWRQALEYGVKVTGCTVHLVDEGIDTGPIVVQRSVPVEPDDTPDSLHRRIQEEEHIAYPEALGLLLRGDYRIVGRRVMQNRAE